MDFLYLLSTPTIVINGKKERRYWGTHTFNLPPGDHEIAISYPWLLSLECGKKTVRISLSSGETKKICYKARIIRFLPGKISITN
jgi:hypothetical protein